MRNKETVLVIEDHESIRMLMKNFLKSEYNVITKNDGLDGLSWMSKGNIPTLIILDMSLPNISGLEFLINIRSSGFFSGIPVIVVSGNESKDFKNQCFDLGISHYLTKPFNPLELQTKIRILLSQRELPSA
ncbi:MAG: response regulator [Saprospiraceae bacterium]